MVPTVPGKRTSEGPSRKLLAAKARGHAADAKGLRFESTVQGYYAKPGWRTHLRKRLVGREFDLVVLTHDDWGTEVTLLVECKDKQRVTPSDVLAFLAKLQKLYEKYSDSQMEAVMAYTGELPKDARECRTG
ncbi:MAG: hypothetical protein O3A47_04940 [Chloroflexi bacterium]|nr:hypothetical protein [Chloroflexota bacterium]